MTRMAPFVGLLLLVAGCGARPSQAAVCGDWAGVSGQVAAGQVDYQALNRRIETMLGDAPERSQVSAAVVNLSHAVRDRAAVPVVQQAAAELTRACGGAA